MRTAAFCFFAVLVLAFGVSTRTSVPIGAQESTQQQTITTVDPPVPVRVGDALQVIVHLTIGDGVPIADQPVVVAAGTTEGRGTTDANGQAVVRLRLLPAGRMTFVATYAGSLTRGLAPSQSWEDTLEVLPLIVPTLRIDPLPAVPLGARPHLVLHAEDDSGQPISGINVQITLDGKRIGTILTDERGLGEIALKPDLASGTHAAVASYDGSPSRNIAAASAELRVDVVVALLQIHTVPALPGVRFQLTELSRSGQPGQVHAFESDAQGVAAVAVDSQGAYTLTAATDPDQAALGRRAEFARWSDDYFGPDRLLYITSSLQLTAGFDVDYRVGHSFRDLSEQPVDAGRVSSVTLTNSLGEETTLPDDQPAWLHGSRIVRRSNGLEASKTLYSIKRVMMDGSNVVNQYEQRFYPEQDSAIPITLSLYSIHISTRDALFGFPVGSAVQLRYPDGHTERVPFGPDHDVSVSSLARGEYKLKIEGNGLSSSPHVALSRDQDVEVRVISYVDIAVAGTFGFIFVVGLLAVGRWRLPLWKRARPIAVALGSMKSGEGR